VIPGDNGRPAFDPSVTAPARMWNYWLGGKDNFAVDRAAAERVVEVMPTMPLIARGRAAVPGRGGAAARGEVVADSGQHAPYVTALMLQGRPVEHGTDCSVN
jgi:hypothetical protein